MWPVDPDATTGHPRSQEQDGLEGQILERVKKADPSPPAQGNHVPLYEGENPEQGRFADLSLHLLPNCLLLY